MTYRSARSSGHALLLISSIICAAANLAQAQSAPATPAPTRGQLLYTTHCIECHNVQMHWRANSQAHDWDGLVAQVARWQSNGQLGWSEEDIREVARHLNDTVYRLSLPQQKASR